MTEGLAIRLAISLGIGLLIGLERERRKGSGDGRAPAGIRTFAIASLAGGLSLAFGGEIVLVAVAVVIGALVAVGYARSPARDPGLTTEIALVTTVLLGALAGALLQGGAGCTCHDRDASGGENNANHRAC